MAVTEASLAPERLSAGDAVAGLGLSHEAGWNQTSADWQVFLERGIVFGIRDDDGRLIATAALLPSPPVTWISMVLVTTAWRRRGLADRLMRLCIREAQSRGWQAGLDATPAGAAVYRTLGFVDTGFGMRRMRRPGMTAGPSQASAGIVQDRYGIDALLDANRQGRGFDCTAIVKSLAERNGSVICRVKNAIALVRNADRVRHIGPVFAKDEDVAIALLDDIVDVERGPLLIDVAADLTRLFRWCEDRGFVFERPFSRMCLGAPGVFVRKDLLMAVTGPEFG